MQHEQFHTSLFDKRDAFNYDIVNYPYVKLSNIPEGPAYGVYASRLLGIARACDSFQDFKLHHDSSCEKLYSQGYKYSKLYKCLNKTTSRHQELFAKYGKIIEVHFPTIALDKKNITVYS